MEQESIKGDWVFSEVLGKDVLVEIVRKTDKNLDMLEQLPVPYDVFLPVGWCFSVVSVW